MLPADYRGQRVFVSDYDGTITKHDFFLRVLDRSKSIETHEYWDDFLAGRLSHFEALRGIFADVKGEKELLEIAHETELDPDFVQGIRRLDQAGWKVLVVSAGCQWYIERLFQEHGVQLPIIGNPGRLTDEGRLEMMLPPEDAAYFSAETGINKQAIVKAALEQAQEVAFAGDGRPDLKAARLVKPELRFACGWLAESLEAEGLPYRPFQRWSDVARALEQM